MIDELIDRFAQRAPVALMLRSLFARLFSDTKLDQLFAEHSVRQVESTLLFSSLVELLTPVVSGAVNSVNASHSNSQCNVSCQAVYDKLKGVEPEVSVALVRSAVSQLRQVQDQSGAVFDDLVSGYHTFVIDGKTYNSTEHRLKESRRDARAPLPGRAIAMLDTRYELFVDVECDANAHRCERKIYEPMMERLQAGALYIADRNFSDSIIFGGFFEAQSFFVVRQHGACPSWRQTGKKPKQYRRPDSNGGKVSEQEIEIKLPDGNWQRVRRVTVDLKKPTRKGDKLLHLLTNLPSAVTGTQITDVYRRRWKIETCLGHLAQSLNAEIKTLAYPGAAGLCFCLALVLFNMMSTIKSHLRKFGTFETRKKVKCEEPFELSYFYMALEIESTLAAFEIVIDPEYWQQYAEMSIAKFARFFKDTASGATLHRYKKNTRAPKKPPPKRKFTGARHVATQKLIEQRL